MNQAATPFTHMVAVLSTLPRPTRPSRPSRVRELLHDLGPLSSGVIAAELGLRRSSDVGTVVRDDLRKGTITRRKTASGVYLYSID